MIQQDDGADQDQLTEISDLLESLGEPDPVDG
jgi:hypothetical protein